MIWWFPSHLMMYISTVLLSSSLLAWSRSLVSALITECSSCTFSFDTKTGYGSKSFSGPVYQCPIGTFDSRIISADTSSLQLIQITQVGSPEYLSFLTSLSFLHDVFDTQATGMLCPSCPGLDCASCASGEVTRAIGSVEKSACVCSSGKTRIGDVCAKCPEGGYCEVGFPLMAKAGYYQTGTSQFARCVRVLSQFIHRQLTDLDAFPPKPVMVARLPHAKRAIVVGLF